MTEREKVMKGLRCLSTPYEDLDDRDCENCKYDNASCFLDIPADALSLLKAQEPRVMTLEELRKTPSGSVLWNEWAQDEEIELYPLEFQRIYMHTFPDGLTEEVVEFSNGMDYADEYGKQYRLWTAKPTDEQREAVKWDAAD